MADTDSDLPQISALTLKIMAAILSIVPIIAVSTFSFIYYWRNPERRKINKTVNFVQFGVIAVLIIICVVGITLAV